MLRKLHLNFGSMTTGLRKVLWYDRKLNGPCGDIVWSTTVSKVENETFNLNRYKIVLNVSFKPNISLLSFFRRQQFIRLRMGMPWTATVVRTTWLLIRPAHQIQELCQIQTVSHRVGNTGDTAYWNTNTFQGPKNNAAVIHCSQSWVNTQVDLCSTQWPYLPCFCISSVCFRWNWLGMIFLCKTST